MRERWYDIPGYEGAYQVSSRGRVRSVPRIDAAGYRRMGRILSPSVGGARQVRRRYFLLSKGGKVTHCCASVLMASACRIQNPEGHSYVVHLNGDYDDFRQSNLRWVTLAELRIHDGLKVGTPYYGVIRNKKAPAGDYPWIAQLRHERRRLLWRGFATPEEAAFAYDREVKRRKLKRPLNNIPKPEPFKRDEIKSLPGEVWRPFPGTGKTHMISSMGRVRTLAYVTSDSKRVAPKLRKITVDRDGCHTILIRGKRYGIKKIVARVFGDAGVERPPSTLRRSRSA